MALNRVYEDFQPPHDWVRDEQSETLILQLEGFSRSQLKVQISAMRRIRVSGERQIEGNIWRRFYSEFPVPQDSDTNNIGAKFERGTLYVRFPKLITPVTPQPPPTQQAPSAAPPPRTQQPPPPPPPPPSPPKPRTREEPKAEQTIEKKPETSDQPKIEQKEKEPPKEEKQQAKEEDISQGKGLVEEEKARKAKAPETDQRHLQKKEEESRRPSSSSFSEGVLGSMQAQDYKDAIVGLVGELKKQKTVINKLAIVLVVLLLGLYLKHLVKSSFGGSKTHQEL